MQQAIVGVRYFVFRTPHGHVGIAAGGTLAGAGTHPL
jgi:hypothetical protein